MGTKIAGIQLHTPFSEVEGNLAKAESAVREAARHGAAVVALQELFATGYFCATVKPARFALAQRVDGPIITRMAALARELGIWLVVPFCEQDERITGRHYKALAVQVKFAGLDPKMADEVGKNLTNDLLKRDGRAPAGGGSGRWQERACPAGNARS